jgi:hypothetical protein
MKERYEIEGDGVVAYELDEFDQDLAAIDGSNRLSGHFDDVVSV